MVGRLFPQKRYALFADRKRHVLLVNLSVTRANLPRVKKNRRRAVGGPRVYRVQEIGVIFPAIAS
jgi:hypothetical protein